ncbi:methyl-accepting chemotaxis protein [Sulfurivermis fontis]|uniref:methyl-accepting chemotaxis protein n=1 Tax=Sulfurivermis fontis TaxID=1972068 RepID=UPI000FD70414|nr:methyl-accepting chemotaxis protein [Sulfurivermis fontis]
MDIVFRPGIGLLNRLRYPHKFLFIGVIFLAPLVVMGYFLVNEVNQRIRFMEQERLGVEYIAQLRKPIQDIQQHRGMSAAFLNGDASFRERMAQRQAAIDAHFATLRSVDQRLGSALKSGDKLATLERQWNTLKGEVTTYTPPQSFERHTALIEGLRDFITYLADTSNLILDPELDSYYLMDLMVARLPALTEGMGQSRAIGSGVAARHAFTPQSWAQLAIRIDRIREAEKALNYNLTTAMRENPALAGRLQQAGAQAASTVASYTTLINGMLEQDQVSVSAAEIFDQSTRAIDAVFGLFDLIVPTLDGLLTQRIADYNNIKAVTLAVMLSVLLAMVYIFSAFYMAVLRSIADLKDAIHRMADGDLTVNLTLQTRDEIRHIADQVNAMASRFRELVGNVLRSTHQVATAAEELSAVSEQTNQGINEQLAQTDQVATAVNQMSATVQEVARSAASTSDATRNAQQESHTGHGVVRDTVKTINALAEEIRSAAGVVRKLGEDSEEIGKVLDVIRTIAEQTNLLALNAAIEAARAGEQGRGFAVVADEVRTLAGRTQQSTQEIQAMIERLQSGARQAVQAMVASESKTEEGVAMAARAGEALDSITRSVATIADMSAQIAAAAEEQATVAEEINRNVTQIAQVSDQNAAASTQTASSSTELARLAEELNGMVAVFRV